jgi:hypothetical protein
MDWIDDLVVSDQANDAAKQLTQELQIHKAKLIEGLAPEFCARVIEKVRADCDKLNLAYRDKPSPHCNFEAIPNGFRLQGNKSPIRTCELTFNIKGQCIYRVDYEYQGPERTLRRDKDTIHFQVNDRDELELNPYGKELSSAEKLSRHLISYVCHLDSAF